LSTFLTSALVALGTYAYVSHGSSNASAGSATLTALVGWACCGYVMRLFTYELQDVYVSDFFALQTFTKFRLAVPKGSSIPPFPPCFLSFFALPVKYRRLLRLLCHRSDSGVCWRSSVLCRDS
jgi:hypothetical protein